MTTASEQARKARQDALRRAREQREAQERARDARERIIQAAEAARILRDEAAAYGADAERMRRELAEARRQAQDDWRAATERLRKAVQRSSAHLPQIADQSNATLTDLETARAELAQIKDRPRRSDLLGITGAVSLGGLIAAALVALLNASGLAGGILGAAATAAATALQARASNQRDKRHREKVDQQFSLRMALLLSQNRRLRRDEIVTFISAWGTTGDPELEAEIRGRLLDEFEPLAELPPPPG